MSVFQWSKTAVNNATVDLSINFSEGMSPSSVNDSCRAVMAAIACWRDDISGIAAIGNGLSFGATTNQVFESLTNLSGAMLTIIPNTANIGAVTLSVDNLVGQPLQKSSTAGALPAGYLLPGVPYTITYIFGNTPPAGFFILHNVIGP